jgi:hypothetical protein
VALDSDELPLSLHQVENIPFGFAAATNVPVFAARFAAGASSERLAAAFRQVIARHQALRFRLTSSAGEAGQRVAALGGVRVDDAGLPAADDSALLGHFEDVLGQRMDLAADGPTVTRIIRLDDGGFGALFAVNHTAADGWSVGVLNRDIACYYRADPDDLPPQLAQDYYARYITETRALGEGLTDRQTEFFRASLHGVPAVAARWALPPAGWLPHHRVQRELDPPDARGVFDLAKRLRTTPAKVLLAASLVAAKMYFEQDDFGILDVSSGRSGSQADWVGLFSKRVPLPVHVPDDMPAAEFIESVHRGSVRALRMLGGPYSLKRALQASPAGESGMVGTLYQRFWTEEPITSHSLMFNCLTIPVPAAAPFDAASGYRPLYPRAVLPADHKRMSDLDILPVIQGSDITIAVEAHPSMHTAAGTELVLEGLSHVLLDWVREARLDNRVGGYRTSLQGRIAGRPPFTQRAWPPAAPAARTAW